MADRKIVVPEGMLKAATEAVLQAQCVGRSPEDGPRSIPAREQISVESALRWLLDELPFPSFNDDECSGPEWVNGYNRAMADVRRMHLAPKPEVPREILDLHVSDTEMGWDSPINKRIIEAYRRGQKSKESK